MKKATDKELVELISKLGLSQKAAKLYLASLELGEATVQDLARQAKVERTTAYYTLQELKEAGAIFETKRNKKVFFLPEMPRNLLRNTREKQRSSRPWQPPFEGTILCQDNASLGF